MNDTIRLYVGTDPQQHIAERALEASVRANTSQTVDITWMRAGDPWWDRGETKEGWATPFTMFRWFIPGDLTTGRALYMDCDQLALGDLTELWEWDMEGEWCATPRKKPDVIVWDCTKTPGLDAADLRDTFRQHRVVLPPEWDHCDTLRADTKILHFTRLRTQPWKPYPERYDYDTPHPDPAAVEKFWEYATNGI